MKIRTKTRLDIRLFIIGVNIRGALDVPGKGIIEPLRLSQDSKLNLLIANGGNQIYAWNQHFNNVGIKAVAENYTLMENEDSTNIFLLDDIDSVFSYLQNGYSIINADFQENEELIDSILAPHIFYDGYDMKNILMDTYGDPRNSKIIDIAAFGKDFDNSIYMLDKRYNRIVKLRYAPKYFLLLEDTSVVIEYQAFFSEVVTSKGTGAGFVLDPNSVSLDESGNIYYTQTNGSFSCHGISAGSYRSIFVPDVNEILDLNRFSIAHDICIDTRALIYVVDAGKNYIQTFDSQGQFQRNIGTVVMDTTIAATDSTFQVEIGDVLNHPESIAIRENTVYVADTGNSRIVRFQYVVLAEQSLEENYNQNNPQ